MKTTEAIQALGAGDEDVFVFRPLGPVVRRAADAKEQALHTYVEVTPARVSKFDAAPHPDADDWEIGSVIDETSKTSGWTLSAFATQLRTAKAAADAKARAAAKAKADADAKAAADADAAKAKAEADAKKTK